MERKGEEKGFLWERVRRRSRAWKLAGAPARVMRWITRGVPCYWKGGAPSEVWNKGNSVVDGDEENEWLDREEKRCIDSGAWRPVARAKYVSRVFLVPKPGLDEAGRRKWRLIIDLRPLNLFCRDFKTRYETLSKLGSLISKGEECLFLSFDLADAYHALRIDPEYQQYFGFVLRGRHYNMTALPFGWNQSPYCFTTAMKTLVKLLRTPGLPSVAEQVQMLRSPAGRSNITTRWVGG